MTDSKTATERICEQLEAAGLSFVRSEQIIEGTYWGVTWSVGETKFEFRENDERTDLIAFNATPQQAIAATLGSDLENELRAALNKAAGNWAKADRLARDIWEQVSHCPDYPIPPCMTESICEQFRNLPDVEQAATLGIGECENVSDDISFVCSACGSECYIDWAGGGCGTPRFCPNCGRRVVNNDN